MMILAALLAASPVLQPTPTPRPLLHYTTEKNWINDPNGLVYSNGEYHLFAQYNPQGDQWGHMSWSHSVSPDLFTWTHLPVAIPEAGPIMAFSGSAVMDLHNTSGFGTADNPPLVAIYTGHNTTKPHESQYIAYSLDRGRTFKVYDKNPVLDLNRAEFRDPKVLWHEPTKRWIMVVSLSNDKQAGLFGSPDLKTWTHLSTFGPAGRKDVPNFECPDLFELPVDGDAKKAKWVLIASSGGNGLYGGVGVQYFIGAFDGTTFTNDNPTDKVLWVDQGTDFYAMQTYFNAPDHKRISVAWMVNAHYAGATPTSPWRGEMTLPRELGLATTKDGVRLTQKPVAQAAAFLRTRGSESKLGGMELAPGVTPINLMTTAAIIDAEFDAAPDAPPRLGFEFRTHDDAAHALTVGYDTVKKELYIDRSKAANTGFAGDRPARFAAPFTPGKDNHVRFTVVYDYGSVEVFSDDGLVAMTALYFPTQPQQVSLLADGKPGKLVRASVIAVP